MKTKPKLKQARDLAPGDIITCNYKRLRIASTTPETANGENFVDITFHDETKWRRSAGYWAILYDDVGVME